MSIRSAAFVALLATISVLGAGGRAAMSGDRRFDFAGVSLVLDDERWQVTSRQGSLEIMPVGPAAGDRARVTVETVRRKSAACAEIALSRLGEAYAEPVVDRTEITGQMALRLSAHSRCRSAQPKGVVACLERGDDVLLLVATKASCRSPGASPFSKVDPLAEIIGGLRARN